MIFVEQALRAMEQQQLELANFNAIPISYATQMLAINNGAKNVDADRFNPFATVLQQQEAKALIPTQAARTFFQLVEENKVPAWAIATIDVTMIRAAAK